MALMANARVPLVARGVVEGGVHSAAQEETVGAAGVGVLPDDLAHDIDVARNGAAGS
jgi:hypothetical protein